MTQIDLKFSPDFFHILRSSLRRLSKTMTLFPGHISETFKPGLGDDKKLLLVSAELVILQSCIFIIVQVNRFVTNLQHPQPGEVSRNPSQVPSLTIFN